MTGLYDIIITIANDYHGVLRNRLRLYPSNLMQIMLSQGIDITKVIFKKRSPYSMATSAWIRGFLFMLDSIGISVFFIYR